jgi:hypothetical protein
VYKRQIFKQAIADAPQLFIDEENDRLALEGSPAMTPEEAEAFAKDKTDSLVATIESNRGKRLGTEVDHGLVGSPIQLSSSDGSQTLDVVQNAVTGQVSTEETFGDPLPGKTDFSATENGTPLNPADAQTAAAIAGFNKAKADGLNFAVNEAGERVELTLEDYLPTRRTNKIRVINDNAGVGKAKAKNFGKKRAKPKVTPSNPPSAGFSINDKIDAFAEAVGGHNEKAPLNVSTRFS